jgi:RNA polymerase subunit RPABC4/transcription elongation factor Spt4
MIAARPGQLGSTRACPHCKATILESAIVCPGCRHHLRFGGNADSLAEQTPQVAWQIEGTLQPAEKARDTEYCIVVVVLDEKNQEIARQVVNVGALKGQQQRRFTLSVETTDSTATPPPRQR